MFVNMRVNDNFFNISHIEHIYAMNIIVFANENERNIKKSVDKQLNKSLIRNLIRMQ